jgi:hypothetical protein
LIYKNTIFLECDKRKSKCLGGEDSTDSKHSSAAILDLVLSILIRFLGELQRVESEFTGLSAGAKGRIIDGSTRAKLKSNDSQKKNTENKTLAFVTIIRGILKLPHGAVSH